MALVSLVLRLAYGIPFDTIYYEVVNVGDRKLLLLHEPDSAGLLEKLDWMEISKKIEEFKPDELSEILLQVVDDQAHFELLSSGMRWDLAKKYARRMLEYLMLREKIRLKLRDVEILVPKPSKALKTAAFDLITLPLSENVFFGCSAIYDGEDSSYALLTKEFFETSGWEEMGKVLNSLIDRGFSIIVHDVSLVLKALSQFGLTSASILVDGLKKEGRLIEVSRLAKDVLGIERVPFEELVRTLGWETSTDLVSLRKELERSSSLLKERGEFKWPYFTKYLRKTAEEYMKTSVINLYKIYYALKGLKKGTELSDT
jgi:DEAD/DEAH box helicase domain-containing protein